MLSEPVVQKFIDTYQTLNIKSLDSLANIYTSDIVFEDPLHQVSGLSSMESYFEQLYLNLNSSHFDVFDRHIVGDHAFIYWRMTFSHKRINKGEDIVVNGHSKLTFDGDKVCYHRDYFDLGELIYQHVPVLGGLIKHINRKASQ